MEAIALNQPITKFLKSKVMACGLDLKGYEALELLKTNPYLVILNEYKHPQGLFTLSSVDEQNRNLCLGELDLEPLPAIADQTTIREFLDRLCKYEYSASIWAVVDRRNRYLGVVEVLPLIRRLAQELNHQSLGQFLNLIQQLPFPVLVCDVGYELIGSNSLWSQEFGDLDIWESKSDSISQLNSQPKHLIKTLTKTWQINEADLTGDLQGLKMAIAQDVSAQEQLAQELLDQNADLVKLNRIKDEFIACISHELKTPLTSLIGMASLLENESIGDLNDRQKRYVNVIHQNGRHLTFMIDNVMDLAKAETGQLELFCEDLSVRDICQQSINKTQKLLQQDHAQAPTLQICLDIDPKIQSIIADEVRMQQMLVNLLSNAAKFAEDTPQISLIVQKWEGWIAFNVSDRGIGIPEDKQHLIFQKFQQLENILTRKYDGVGLGLVLTRHLARLHGGDVTFMSQVGKGSEFTILLPTTNVKLSKNPPEKPLNKTIGENIDSKISEQIKISTNQLVLVVENIPEDIDHLVTVLTSLKYRVAIARSGIEALEKARKLQPSLIFLSPDLPILSGWDVLSLLKKDAATTAIKVLMTVKDSPNNNVLIEADWQLPKPIQAQDLSFLKNFSSKITILSIGESNNLIQLQIQNLGHQIIFASDLSQGEMLAKIWQPQLIVSNYISSKLTEKLTRISRSSLKALPILLVCEADNFTLEPIPENLRSPLSSQILARKSPEELDIYPNINTQFANLNLHFLAELSHELNPLNDLELNQLIHKLTANRQIAG